MIETSLPPPGLMIAAPRSGSGKTTLTLGLLRALQSAGVAVGSAKCGPDYIDPPFHQAASGRPSLNLDSWAMPPWLLSELAIEVGIGCDLVICEALMGLFDGVPGPAGRTGSSADVAATLGWPVLLVLDASGQSQSAAAVVKGCATYDTRITIAGIVLNRVGSARHARLASEAIEALGIPVVGALPRSDSIALRERHLGLVQAAETGNLDIRLDQIAAFVAEHTNINVIQALASRGHATPLRARLSEEAGSTSAINNLLKQSERQLNVFNLKLPSSRGAARPAVQPPGQRIAIARDAAFSFLYPHLLQGWRMAGAEIRFFSPLANQGPDEECDVCWLPGGYPEIHAAKLVASQQFFVQLRHFAETRPVHGECGGYMVLGASLTDANDVIHPMAGLLSVSTSFAHRKLNLGYRNARLIDNGCLGPAGTQLRGHEFHYATVKTLGNDAPFALVTDAYGADPVPTGNQRGPVSGSFFHVIAAEP